MILALNAKEDTLINALNAILQIIVKKNLMKINLENANVMMVTMMMKKIIYVSNALYFGYLN